MIPRSIFYCLAPCTQSTCSHVNHSLSITQWPNSTVRFPHPLLSPLLSLSKPLLSHCPPTQDVFTSYGWADIAPGLCGHVKSFTKIPGEIKALSRVQGMSGLCMHEGGGMKGELMRRSQTTRDVVCQYRNENTNKESPKNLMATCVNSSRSKIPNWSNC